MIIGRKLIIALVATFSFIAINALETPLAEFSPDSQKVIAASGKTAKLYSANGNISGIYHNKSITSIKFSPDSQKAIVVSDDKVTIVNAITGFTISTIYF
jgi:WD40 repeat protein